MTNESFSEFVGQYEKLVFTVCFQMVRDYQEAQNLAQETFLAAYRSIDRCRPNTTNLGSAALRRTRQRII